MAAASSNTENRTKEILYSAENFIAYREELENAIAEKPQASIVYSGVRKDPVTSFKQYNLKAVELQKEDDVYGEEKVTELTEEEAASSTGPTLPRTERK